MKELKKVVSIVLFTIFMFCISASFVGCKKEPLLDNNEYFIYIVSHQRNEVSILGLTDAGKEQEYLVIPETIDGKKVRAVGCHTGLTVTEIMKQYGDAKYSQFQSERLKKIFFVSDVEIIIGWGSGNLIENLPPFEAIFYISNQGDVDRPEVFFFRTSLMGETNLKSWDRQLENPHYCNFAANVSYYYNYENAKNDGYYWIDNYEYGETIEYIPENPIREGYTFGGWYKEPECINVWDFATDRLPEIKYNGQGVRIYQETKLYAKWIKK